MTRLSPRAVVALAGDKQSPCYRIGPVLALKDEEQTDTGAASSADVYVYGAIGGWLGMDADDFVRDVASLDVEQIVLHLNTPGGDAMEGVAIANVLRAHKARVVVRVDGMAASAGSVIAMAGDEVVMGLGSQLMIHDAWGVCVGDASEVAAFGRRLDATSNSIASTYAAKAGGTTEEWRDVMRSEAWYTPEEAVAAGLADRVATKDEVATAEGEQVTPGGSSSFWDMWDSLREPDRFDLSAFTYAGRAHAPAPAMPGTKTPAASAVGATTQEKGGDVAFSDEQLTTMRQRLGLAADANEATIVAALEEALEEQVQDRPAAPRLPEGVVTIEEATLNQLRASAQRGDEARAQQERESRERAVDAAIADGRVAPARRDAWLNRLAADAGELETLNSLEKGLVPVEALGSDDAPDSTSADDVYALVYGKEA
ncbi:MAG TPA: head maturation protease, ClpP-related [Nocardioides sp.]